MLAFPTDARAPQRRSAGAQGACAGETQLFSKTRPCSFYAKGRCKRGQACSFAHGDEDLRPQPDFFRTQLCVEFFRDGSCSFGMSCRYAHSPQEIRRSNVPRKRVAPTQEHVKAPAPAVPSALQPRRQVESLEAQIRALQAELQARQSSLQIVAPPPSADKDDDECDFTACANGWSRQSTAEGPAQPDAELSEDDAESWCGDFDERQAEGEGRAPQEIEREEAVSCELVVRRTFLCLTPSEPACSRRSHSAPPSRCHALASR